MVGYRSFFSLQRGRLAEVANSELFAYGLLQPIALAVVQRKPQMVRTKSVRTLLVFFIVTTEGT